MVVRFTREEKKRQWQQSRILTTGENGWMAFGFDDNLGSGTEKRLLHPHLVGTLLGIMVSLKYSWKI